MALTTTQRDGLIKLYVGVFDFSPNVEALNFYSGVMNDQQKSLGEMANILLIDDQGGSNTFPNFLTSREFVTKVFVNMYGWDAAAIETNPVYVEGVTYWTNYLEADLNGDRGELIAITMAELEANGPTSTDATTVEAAATLANKLEVAKYYVLNNGGDSSDLSVLRAIVDVDGTAASVAAVKAAIDSGAIDPTETAFTLTTGLDNLIGSDGDDEFVARVVQNVNGEQTNQLATGDQIDGGADGADGDTLNAIVQMASALNNDPTQAITPETVDVENAYFTALSVEDGVNDANGETVTINAKFMLGLDEVGSVESDASLLIENLTTLQDDGVYANRRNTEDVTIRMDHTGNDAAVDQESDLTVLFDNDYLIAGQTNSSTLELRMVNAFALADDNAPLDGFISVSFLYGTELVTVDIEDLATYAEVQAAIEAELVAQNITDVTVTLLADRDAIFTDDVGIYEQGDQAGLYTPILLSSTGETLDRGETATDNSTINANFLNTQTPTTASADNPITATVELLKVGRGAEGGALVIGGMATDFANVWDYSENALEEGISVFDITVDGDETQNSSLSALASTNNTLTQVNVVWAADSDADLIIGNHNTDSLLGDFEGLTTDLNGALKDVRVFDATNGDTNDVTVHAHLSDEVVAKYMDLTDAVDDAQLDNADFAYSFAAGDDLLNINISQTNLAASGTTNREDFTMAIEMGDGDDTVQTQIGNGEGLATAAWYINSELNDNLAIDAGAGNDTVETYGAGSWNVDLGTGDDVIYNDNSDDRAVWVFNTADQVGVLAAARNIDDLVSDTINAYAFYQAEVTVDLNGVSNTVTIDAYNTTDNDLNNAIKRAIQEDVFLNKLLVAEDGPAGTLVIRSLVDGVTVAEELEISIDSTTLDTMTASEIAAFNAENGTAFTTTAQVQAAVDAAVVDWGTDADYVAALANDVVADLTGGDSNAVTAADIEAGAGNDVVVLSTSGLDTETVDVVDDEADLVYNATNAIVSMDVLDSLVTSGLIQVSSVDGDVTVLTGNSVIGSTANDTILGGAGDDTILGGAGNDTIVGGAGTDLITGGAGADSISTGADTVVGGNNIVTFGNTDSGITVATADTWSDFVSGIDSIEMGAVGDATANTGNYVEAGAAAADFAAALLAANVALAVLAGTSAATELYAFEFDATNGYVFDDIDGDGDADQVIVLTGVINTDISAADFV